MICKFCRYENPESAKFCGKCGCKLDPKKKNSEKSILVMVIILVCFLAIVCSLLIFRQSSDDVPLETTCQHEWQNNGVTSICTKCRGVIITPSDADSSQKTDNQSVTTELVTAQKNQMSRDFIPPVPENLYPGTDNNKGYLRSITFVDTLKYIPSEYVVDVSAGQDGSVLAWYEIESDTGACDLYVGAEGTIIAPENCEALFSCDGYLEEIRFNNCFDTSNVTNMRDMFAYCMGLKELDLSSFDTSNVTDMSFMFFKTFDLDKLNISSFNTTSVTSMAGMFSQCGIEKVNLNSFDTSNVTDMSGMFEKCGGLKELDISNFITSTETDIAAMFYQCYSLEKLNICGFDLSAIPDEDVPGLLFMDSEVPELFITNSEIMSAQEKEKQVSSITQYSGGEVSVVTMYDYNKDGKLLCVERENWYNGENNYTVTTNYIYNADGQLIAKKDLDAPINDVEYVYDGNIRTGYVENTYWSYDDGSYQLENSVEYTFVRDDNGNVIKKTTVNPQPELWTTGMYTYDMDDHLIAAYEERRSGDHHFKLKYSFDYSYKGLIVVSCKGTVSSYDYSDTIVVLSDLSCGSVTTELYLTEGTNITTDEEGYITEIRNADNELVCKVSYS